MERDGTGESALPPQPVDVEGLRAQAARAYEPVRELSSQTESVRALDSRAERGNAALALARVAVRIRDLTENLLRSHEQEAVATASREWGTGDAHAVFAQVADAAYQATYNQFEARLRPSAEGSAPRTDVLDELSLRVHGYLAEVVDAYGQYLIAVAPTPHPHARRFPAVGLDAQGRSQVVTARTGTAFVLGHGQDPDTGDVRVPQGRTVSFYADLNTGTAASVAHAVHAAGDILPRQTYHAGQNIPNYELRNLTDHQMATELASMSDRLPGKMYLVGADWPLGDSPLQLCTAPKVCASPALGYDPDQSTRHHPGCTGLFNRLAEADLHLLICRRLRGAPLETTAEMDVRPVLDDRGLPVTRTTPYGDEPDAYVTRLHRQKLNIYTWAGTDLAAAVTYVHSLPQATVAALLSYTDFELWLEWNQHTPDPRSPQAQAVTDFVVTNFEHSPGWGRRWWRALPQAAREVLSARPAVRDCLRRLGEPVTQPHQGRITPAPAEFSDAWNDIHWRNAFTTWLTTTTPTPPQQPLLTLYALLHPITSPKTYGTTMTTDPGFGDLATLTDTDILPTAEHILTHSRNHGHIPALAQPHLLDTLETDLHHFDPDIATEAGLDNTGTANPILIRQDLQHLNTSLTHQLNTHYQTYRQSTESRQ